MMVAHAPNGQVKANVPVYVAALCRAGIRVVLVAASDQPLVIGGAHIARRVDGAKIDPGSDRILTFRKLPSTTIPARSMAVSDPVELDVPALSDLAVSIFLPNPTAATTDHALALQTNYVSPETGDHAAEASFPVAEKIDSWPFLTGVDVAASPGGDRKSVV